MDVLRRIRQTHRTLVNILVRRSNAIASFKTYCTLTKVQTKPQLVENNKFNNNNNKQQESCTPVTIDEATIRRLEKLALVGIEYKQSKRVLEEAVAFAERLRQVHIDETVRPMYSILENEHIHLRDDVTLPHDVNHRCEILKNAAVLEEEYFVAPLTGKYRIKYIPHIIYNVIAVFKYFPRIL
ncbi:PREDICTED: glutamyl-tRNA(Gln) amidotransferase subunit C, mitochondrial [Dinoponera quadriceps]|uniref:Glutamyl-tRNA(Gln) amidotransferase subunit C, mitochondrial n=1 Tax=Dinoponera quadriceps TaxID=609295 RepID=A0A6P3XZC0_DINQU|nr:PREDICTED: glutamyl-tRNA(Gln) amidotransferase subunit C, mitochondrial [Dinoponera quadriceps]